MVISHLGYVKAASLKFAFMKGRDREMQRVQDIQFFKSGSVSVNGGVRVQLMFLKSSCLPSRHFVLSMVS